RKTGPVKPPGSFCRGGCGVMPSIFTLQTEVSVVPVANRLTVACAASTSRHGKSPHWQAVYCCFPKDIFHQNNSKPRVSPAAGSFCMQLPATPFTKSRSQHARLPILRALLMNPERKTESVPKRDFGTP